MLIYMSPQKKVHDVEFALADEQGLELQSFFTSTRCLCRIAVT